MAVRFGAGGGELDPSARGREAQVGELDAGLLEGCDGAAGDEGGEVDAEAGAFEQRVDQIPVALVELGVAVAHRPGEPAEDLRVGQ
jgi:hypothetical protein